MIEFVIYTCRLVSTHDTCRGLVSTHHVHVCVWMCESMDDRVRDKHLSLHITPVQHLPPHSLSLHITSVHITPLHITLLHITPLDITPVHITPLHITLLHITLLHITPLHIFPRICMCVNVSCVETSPLQDNHAGCVEISPPHSTNPTI